ncbi:MAG: hypothetical protein BWY63_00743 [Chloroflexi bacterium ADurb.Bin360]|nr:MAG: hypothetical protein BWY63_00743 [Chloroflexi bacterium ADurb.Bin360]
MRAEPVGEVRGHGPFQVLLPVLQHEGDRQAQCLNLRRPLLEQREGRRGISHHVGRDDEEGLLPIRRQLRQEAEEPLRVEAPRERLVVDGEHAPFPDAARSRVVTGAAHHAEARGQVRDVARLGPEIAHG